MLPVVCPLTVCVFSKSDTVEIKQPFVERVWKWQMLLCCFRSSSVSLWWWQWRAWCSEVVPPDCKTASHREETRQSLIYAWICYCDLAKTIPNFEIMTKWLESFQRVCRCESSGVADWKDLSLFGKACWSKPKAMLWCVNQTARVERPVADERETDSCVKIVKTLKKKM